MAKSKTVKTSLQESGLLSARLSGQLLAGHDISSPQTIVQKMGAIQAQHFDMVKWALGNRLSKCAGDLSQPNGKAFSVSEIHRALSSGEIVRTHALRPTWHLLAAEDLFWIQQLTAPAIKSVLFSRDKHLGIVEKEYVKSDEAIGRILEEQKALSRQELTTALTEKGFAMDEYRTNHYIMHAELNGLICSGPVKEDKHTYALSKNMLGKRYTKALKLKSTLQGEAAVLELTKRYFSTRGPATLQDFAWWSGLGLTVIRKAIAQLGTSLEILPGDNDSSTKFYQWQNGVDPVLVPPAGFGLQLLPAFDEYLISYRDRTKMLPERHRSQIITVNGMFRPAIIENGIVIGGWQVEKGKRNGKGIVGCKLKLLPFEPFSSARKKEILSLAEAAFETYCRFRESQPDAIVFA